MDVLVDLTPLDSAARYRGIGRYVHSLGSALAALTPEERSGLAIGALTSLRRGGVSSDLGWPGDPGWRTYPACHRVYRWRRRLQLGRAAARSGARLWHRTDPFGTPRRAATPYVVTCFDLIPAVLHDLYLAGRPWAPWKQRRADARRYAGATRVLAISEATRRDVVAHVGVEPERVDVAHLGVDTALFHTHATDGEDVRARRALGTSRPFLLYVGGGDARKNLPRLVDAFAASGVASDVDLVLVGMLERAAHRELHTTVARSGVAHAVRLPGHVTDADVAAAYRTCLAHVCPSLYEGFGLTVAESMACGAPTLTTSRGSLPEVTGDAALLVDGEDTDELADVLRRIVSDGALRDDLARRGPPRAARFTWRATAQATVASYRRALDALD